jgi:hypothetical protein
VQLHKSFGALRRQLSGPTVACRFGAELRMPHDRQGIIAIAPLTPGSTGTILLEYPMAD